MNEGKGGIFPKIIENEKKLIKMSFDNAFDKSINMLYPLVMARYDSQVKLIIVEAQFFLRLSEDVEFTEGGEPKVGFEIDHINTHNNRPVFKISFNQNDPLESNYTFYKFGFKFDCSGMDNIPTEIITSVKNDDPEGSRGTVTTVQSGG